MTLMRIGCVEVRKPLQPPLINNMQGKEFLGVISPKEVTQKMATCNILK
jgi:hypothetical protein